MEASVINALIAIAWMSVNGVATLFLDGLGQVFTINGRSLSSGYHGLSHHGNDQNDQGSGAVDTHLECCSLLENTKSEKDC